MQAPLEAYLRASPQDHDSWRVYGDWLSDQGDVRGKLIHLELQDRPELQPELDALREQHQSQWGLQGAPEGCQREWRHGFVVGVTLPWNEDISELVPDLLAQPEARFLVTLRLRSERDPYEENREELPFEWLAELDLSQLLSLDLAYNGLTPPAARALARSPHLSGLTSLDLRYNHLGDEGAAALAEARLERLVSLHLQHNYIGPEGAAALAAAPFPLETLDLRFNPLDTQGARALARSPLVSRLTSLYLHRSDLGKDGARVLAESEHLPLPLRRYWKGS